MMREQNANELDSSVCILRIRRAFLDVLRTFRVPPKNYFTWAMFITRYSISNNLNNFKTLKTFQDHKLPLIHGIMDDRIVMRDSYW